MYEKLTKAGFCEGKGSGIELGSRFFGLFHELRGLKINFFDNLATTVLCGVEMKDYRSSFHVCMQTRILYAMLV